MWLRLCCSDILSIHVIELLSLSLISYRLIVFGLLLPGKYRDRVGGVQKNPLWRKPEENSTPSPRSLILSQRGHTVLIGSTIENPLLSPFHSGLQIPRIGKLASSGAFSLFRKSGPKFFTVKKLGPISMIKKKLWLDRNQFVNNSYLP